MRLLIVGSHALAAQTVAAAEQAGFQSYLQAEWHGDVDLDAFVAVCLTRGHSSSAVASARAICRSHPRVSIVLVGTNVSMPDVDMVIPEDSIADELGPRLLAIVRRSFGHADGSIKLGDLSYDISDRSVRLMGTRVQFHDRELELFELLALRRGEIVSTAELASYVYGPNPDIKSNVIKFHIHRLRKKLAMLPQGEDYLRTIGKRGFILEAPAGH